MTIYSEQTDTNRFDGVFQQIGVGDTFQGNFFSEWVLDEASGNYYQQEDYVDSAAFDLVAGQSYTVSLTSYGAVFEGITAVTVSFDNTNLFSAEPPIVFYSPDPEFQPQGYVNDQAGIVTHVEYDFDTVHVTFTAPYTGTYFADMYAYESGPFGGPSYSLSLNSDAPAAPAGPTEQDDVLIGDADANTIDALGGADSVEGLAGDDTLIGGFGADTVLGGEGADSIDGGQDSDSLSGGAGSDVISGGGGDDTLEGGLDADTLQGGNGEDWIQGGDGNDSLNGGNDGDYLDGGAGDDTLMGGTGIDGLVGGDGNDVLDAGFGDDTIYGDAGNDVFVVINNGGNDQFADFTQGEDRIDVTALGVTDISEMAISVSGGVTRIDFGSGNAVEMVLPTGTTLTNADFILTPAPTVGTGPDTVQGSSGSDVVNSGDGDDKVYGNYGDDNLSGGDGRDTLDGGLGADTISGDQGNDHILGGGGADSLSGGNNNDKLYGGDQADVLSGDQGNDKLYGDAGDDTLDGGRGRDVLTGGSGADLFVFGSNSGVDVITDFEDGSDLIDLTALNLSGMGDLVLSQIGGNVQISLDGSLSNTITLTGTDLADIDASDFLF